MDNYDDTISELSQPGGFYWENESKDRCRKFKIERKKLLKRLNFVNRMLLSCESEGGFGRRSRRKGSRSKRSRKGSKGSRR